nr:unnamed protein product [Haemonchus contortus]
MGFRKNTKKDEKAVVKEEPAKKVPLLQLWRYATWSELALLFVGIFVSLVTGAGLPLMSIIQGQVTQAFVKEEMYKTHTLPGPIHYNDTDFTNDVMNAVYGYTGMAVGMFIAANVQVTCFLIVCEQMSNRIRRKFVKAILHQDISWFDKNNSGTLATKLFDNIERVKEGTGDKIGLIFQYTSQFVTGFVIAFTHSWKLTLVMLAVTPLQAFCGFAISKSMSTFTIAEAIKYAKAGRMVEQTVSSIRTVCSLNGLRYEIERYKVALLEARRAGILKSLFVGLSFALMGLTNFSSFALAFYIGITWTVDGQLELKDLMTTFFSVMMGSLALGQAGPQFAVLGAAQGAAASIYEVLDREPEIDSTSPEGRRDVDIKGNIVVKNVVFNYPSRPDVPVLKNLSLTVNAGETVALVGSSGCGKSTIVSLLLRYYNVLKGEIIIDGVPISDINIQYLRNRIAVVSQEPILFNCTIEENIRMGRSDLTYQQVVDACRMANAETFINGLPQATDVPNLRSAIDFRLSTVIMTLISMLAGIVLAFFYGWQMAFLVVGILPLLGIGQALRVRVMGGKHRKNAKDFEDSGKVAMEAIEHVRTVQALTKEEAFHQKFCDYLDAPHRDALRESFIQGVAYGFATSIVYVLNCCSYRLGLYLIVSSIMMPTRVLRVMYAITISSSTLGFASAYFPEYMKAAFAGGIIFNMLKQKSSIDNLTHDGKKEKLSGAITFKNVKFSYPERPQIEVLKGLSFTAKPGETLALVGPSGCGKSTVVSLIERFYDVKAGQVLLDSHDLRSLNPYHTRSQIAIVSQEPILFDCSIADNIVYGMEVRPSQTEIENAARKANIHTFIKGLPDGYETGVGDKGTQLSGGQKQRIAIARALIRSPKILLLDEATSALDTESEKVVQEALDRAREGRTCIVIAHRLSTVVNADCIAVVKGGLIIEQGTHTELMAKRGFYYELTQKQTVKSASE